MDVDRLKTTYKDNEWVRYICDCMAERRNNQWSTSTDLMMKNLEKRGHDPRRADVTAAFKQLEDCDCGNFHAGRRTHPSEVRMVRCLHEGSRSGTGPGSRSYVRRSTCRRPRPERARDARSHVFIARGPRRLFRATRRSYGARSREARKVHQHAFF